MSPVLIIFYKYMNVNSPKYVVGKNFHWETMASGKLPGIAPKIITRSTRLI